MILALGSVEVAQLESIFGLDIGHALKVLENKKASALVKHTKL